MAEVVVFGVAAWDEVLRVPALPGAGGHVTGQVLGGRIGGSSANLACGLSSAGHHVRLVGPVGTGSVGDRLVAELGRHGVDTSLLFRTAGRQPGALILLEDSGERAIIGLGDRTPARFLPSGPLGIASADCVYVESYERYPTAAVEAVRTPLLVTSPPVQQAGAWPADVVVGSAHQFDGDGLRTPYETTRSAAGARLKWVVVTRGPDGAEAFGPGRRIAVPAVAARQVDATGAGDAFAAGLLHGLIEHQDIRSAMEIGAAWGAAAVGTLQSVPPPFRDVVVRRG